jgi:hypothetical protein
MTLILTWIESLHRTRGGTNPSSQPTTGRCLTTPDLIEDRSNVRAERLADHIRRTVDALPPLTEAQRNRLAQLLRDPASDSGGAAA